VKLLFDENLPPSAARTVATAFPESRHVNQIGLARAQDREIFRYAAENDFTIVTRDRDFRFLSLSRGAPPKVVIVNIDNTAVARVAHLIVDNAPDIRAFIAANEPSLMSIGSSGQPSS
jgi:predicted nuclease of predicted toxin-antitoxin system